MNYNFEILEKMDSKETEILFKAVKSHFEIYVTREKMNIPLYYVYNNKKDINTDNYKFKGNITSLMGFFQGMLKVKNNVFNFN